MGTESPRAAWIFSVLLCNLIPLITIYLFPIVSASSISRITYSGGNIRRRLENSNARHITQAKDYSKTEEALTPSAGISFPTYIERKRASERKPRGLFSKSRNEPTTRRKISRDEKEIQKSHSKTHTTSETIDWGDGNVTRIWRHEKNSSLLQSPVQPTSSPDSKESSHPTPAPGSSGEDKERRKRSREGSGNFFEASPEYQETRKKIFHDATTSIEIIIRQHKNSSGRPKFSEEPSEETQRTSITAFGSGKRNITKIPKSTLTSLPSSISVNGGSNGQVNSDYDPDEYNSPKMSHDTIFDNQNLTKSAKEVSDREKVKGTDENTSDIENFSMETPTLTPEETQDVNNSARSRNPVINGNNILKFKAPQEPGKVDSRMRKDDENIHLNSPPTITPNPNRDSYQDFKIPQKDLKMNQPNLTASPQLSPHRVSSSFKILPKSSFSKETQLHRPPKVPLDKHGTELIPSGSGGKQNVSLTPPKNQNASHWYAGEDNRNKAARPLPSVIEEPKSKLPKLASKTQAFPPKNDYLLKASSPWSMSSKFNPSNLGSPMQTHTRSQMSPAMAQGLKPHQSQMKIKSNPNPRLNGLFEPPKKPKINPISGIFSSMLQSGQRSIAAHSEEILIPEYPPAAQKPTMTKPPKVVIPPPHRQEFIIPKQPLSRSALVHMLLPDISKNTRNLETFEKVVNEEPGGHKHFNLKQSTSNLTTKPIVVEAVKLESEEEVQGSTLHTSSEVGGAETGIQAFYKKNESAGFHSRNMGGSSDMDFFKTRYSSGGTAARKRPTLITEYTPWNPLARSVQVSHRSALVVDNSITLNDFLDDPVRLKGSNTNESVTTDNDGEIHNFNEILQPGSKSLQDDNEQFIKSTFKNDTSVTKKGFHPNSTDILLNSFLQVTTIKPRAPRIEVTKRFNPPISQINISNKDRLFTEIELMELPQSIPVKSSNNLSTPTNTDLSPFLPLPPSNETSSRAPITEEINFSAPLPRNSNSKSQLTTASPEHSPWDTWLATARLPLSTKPPSLLATNFPEIMLENIMEPVGTYVTSSVLENKASNVFQKMNSSAIDIHSEPNTLSRQMSLPAVSTITTETKTEPNSPWSLTNTSISADFYNLDTPPMFPSPPTEKSKNTISAPTKTETPTEHNSMSTKITMPGTLSNWSSDQPQIKHAGREIELILLPEYTPIFSLKKTIPLKNIDSIENLSSSTTSKPNNAQRTGPALHLNQERAKISSKDQESPHFFKEYLAPEFKQQQPNPGPHQKQLHPESKRWKSVLDSLKPEPSPNSRYHESAPDSKQQEYVHHSKLRQPQLDSTKQKPSRDFKKQEPTPEPQQQQVPSNSRKQLPSDSQQQQLSLGSEPEQHSSFDPDQQGRSPSSKQRFQQRNNSYNFNQDAQQLRNITGSSTFNPTIIDKNATEIVQDGNNKIVISNQSVQALNGFKLNSRYKVAESVEENRSTKKPKTKSDTRTPPAINKNHSNQLDKDYYEDGSIIPKKFLEKSKSSDAISRKTDKFRRKDSKRVQVKRPGEDKNPNKSPAKYLSGGKYSDSDEAGITTTQPGTKNTAFQSDGESLTSKITSLTTEENFSIENLVKGKENSNSQPKPLHNDEHASPPQKSTHEPDIEAIIDSPSGVTVDDPKKPTGSRNKSASKQNPRKNITVLNPAIHKVTQKPSWNPIEESLKIKEPAGAKQLDVGSKSINSKETATESTEVKGSNPSKVKQGKLESSTSTVNFEPPQPKSTNVTFKAHSKNSSTAPSKSNSNPITTPAEPASMSNADGAIKLKPNPSDQDLFRHTQEVSTEQFVTSIVPPPSAINDNNGLSGPVSNATGNNLKAESEKRRPGATDSSGIFTTVSPLNTSRLHANTTIYNNPSVIPRASKELQADPPTSRIPKFQLVADNATPTAGTSTVRSKLSIRSSQGNTSAMERLSQLPFVMELGLSTHGKPGKAETSDESPKSSARYNKTTAAPTLGANNVTSSSPVVQNGGEINPPSTPTKIAYRTFPPIPITRKRQS